MNTLLIATTNKGKVAELTALIEDLPFRVISLDDLLERYPPVEETGSTFVANALLKADYFHQQTGLLTLAEDSGLEVDALGGRPGVYSARYGGEGLTNSERIQLLLGELKDVPEEKRSARFLCSIALVGENLRQTFEAQRDGKIALEPRGSEGFGYDPIFIDSELGCTFAEISMEEKASRSHRGKAFRQASEFLSYIE
jgi:XTP/dITP diphosphohydrolase